MGVNTANQNLSITGIADDGCGVILMLTAADGYAISRAYQCKLVRKKKLYKPFRRSSGTFHECIDCTV